MSTLSRQYQPSRLDNVEDVENYAPGGFHPIHIGDVFKDRYKVLHKLGHGGFSTVWLANDICSRRYVALKVISADGSKNCTDLMILELLAGGSVDHPGQRHIASLLDYFSIDGPNGSHMCLVSQVAGPSVTAINDSPGQVAGSRRLRRDLARKIAKQTVQALHFMHSRRVCHGDFAASNVLFQLVSIDTWSEEEIYERFGDPVKDVILTLSGSTPGTAAPQYLVESSCIVDPKFLSEEILLIDFGQAFLFDKPPAKEDIGIPLSYCAPEVIFDSKLSAYSDIWALGCVLFETRAGEALFTSWLDGQDEVLRQMVQTFGKLPDEWWNAWKSRRTFFEEDGNPRNTWEDGIVRAVEYSMEDMIADIGAEDEESAGKREGEVILEPSGARIPAEEAVQFRKLLEAVLRWIPEERCSLEETLKNPWFQLDS